MAAWNSMLVFLVLINMNLVTLAAILVHYKVEQFTTINKIQAAIIAIVFFGVNYFLFVYKKKYLIIEERFDKLSDKKKSFRTILFVIYFLFTIIAIFTVFPLLGFVPN